MSFNLTVMRERQTETETERQRENELKTLVKFPFFGMSCCRNKHILGFKEF